MFEAMAYQRLSKYQTISHYSKPVGCENSKCLDFVSVQVKHSSKQVIFFSHGKRNEKMSHASHNGIPNAFKISNYFPLFKASEL